jgi:hypothetical protein
VAPAGPAGPAGPDQLTGSLGECATGIVVAHPVANAAMTASNSGRFIIVSNRIECLMMASLFPYVGNKTAHFANSFASESCVQETILIAKLRAMPARICALERVAEFFGK